MSAGKDIYRLLKETSLPLADLKDADLRALLGHLGRRGKITGTAGRIWGEALAEAALRFMRAKAAAAPATAATTGALADFVTPDPDA
jgi:hypothetical protein